MLCEVILDYSADIAVLEREFSRALTKLSYMRPGEIEKHLREI
jgi:hypothetical protein